MGLLNHFFGSTESITRELELDDETIIKKWKKYLTTVRKKKTIVERLMFNSNFRKDLHELKRLLCLELVDISGEEKEESELISDLETIEHSQKIKRVRRLEQCLGYAETKYEHIYMLLHHLHSILRIEIHLVEKLLAGSKSAEKLIAHLKLQLELELELIEQIKQIETFHGLFLALIKGEYIIQTMDSKEKKLFKMMQDRMSKIFSGEVDKGITYEWAMTVFDGIEDKVHEGVANEMFSGYHPDIDFEFANRSEFVDLVRESIHHLGKKKVSEQMINVFVHIFREWYNHERD
ncbi:MAG: hypothetical protein ABIH82_01895 [Candidatus Woesearchaeota archaeon]